MVDGELQGVVELALDPFGRFGDVDVFEDRERVEQTDLLLLLGRDGLGLQVVEFGDLVGAVGFESFEATA